MGPLRISWLPESLQAELWIVLWNKLQCNPLFTLHYYRPAISHSNYYHDNAFVTEFKGTEAFSVSDRLTFNSGIYQLLNEAKILYSICLLSKSQTRNSRFMCVLCPCWAVLKHVQFSLFVSCLLVFHLSVSCLLSILHIPFSSRPNSSLCCINVLSQINFRRHITEHKEL
jgi:hypothetical protein